MDSKKDIHLGESQKELVNKAHLDVLLKDDHQLLFILRKIEKITAAVYLITNAVSSEEPLRSHIREKALSLMSALFSLKEGPVGDLSIFFNRNVSLVSDINSYVDLAVFSGVISEMNGGILKQQYQGLLEVIQTRVEDASKSPFVGTDFFKVDESLLLQTKTSPSSYRQDVRIETKTIQTIPSPQPAFRKGQNNVLYNSAPSQTGTIFKNTTTPVKDKLFVKGDRKEKIIGLLKKKPNLTIRDFALVITDCSEKTIQRELLVMVSQGVLKKQGERRWSTYSLV